MPPQLISISRRTDIPAFYGDWFMRRVAEGFAGWENPFGRQCRLVSLQREDVRCLAFWSKNFRPFLPNLRTLQQQGYPCFFNYTITGLPSVFETHTVPPEDAIASLREIASRFSPDHINWRYDPIVLSDLTPAGYHLARFDELAAALQGQVTRCIISFVWRYSKVERNFSALEQARDFRIFDPYVAVRRNLAAQFAAIAATHGMTIHSCCGDYLVSPPQSNAPEPPGKARAYCSAKLAKPAFATKHELHVPPGCGGSDGPVIPIFKAHCLAGETISRLYYGGNWHPAARPTRPECGCVENVDIGRYDTCPHGCAYCYATANKSRADDRHRAHDPAAAFLGCTKEESGRLVAEVRGENKHKSIAGQMELSI